MTQDNQKATPDNVTLVKEKSWTDRAKTGVKTAALAGAATTATIGAATAMGLDVDEASIKDALNTAAGWLPANSGEVAIAGGVTATAAAAGLGFGAGEKWSTRIDKGMSIDNGPVRS